MDGGGWNEREREREREREERERERVDDGVWCEVWSGMEWNGME